MTISRSVKRWRLRHARRVIIGAGKTEFSGWFATNKGLLDITDSELIKQIWPKASVTHFLAEHVWEHLTAEEGLQAACNCASVLLPGGRLRIAVPDGNHPDQEYVADVRPGGRGEGADDHKVLYSVESLSEMLIKAGLKPMPLEWWDEAGVFHCEDWNPSDGMVRRTARHDNRNAGGELRYTSLLVDGMKF